jgi:phosphopantothenate synthetase
MDNQETTFVSPKTAMVSAAAALVRTNNDLVSLSGNRIVLLTAAGTITGTCVIPSGNGSYASLLASEIVDGAARLSSEPVASITLYDAELVHEGGFIQKFQFLCVFTQDVIRITLAVDNN